MLEVDTSSRVLLCGAWLCAVPVESLLIGICTDTLPLIFSASLIIDALSESNLLWALSLMSCNFFIYAFMRRRWSIMLTASPKFWGMSDDVSESSALSSIVCYEFFCFSSWISSCRSSGGGCKLGSSVFSSSGRAGLIYVSGTFCTGSILMGDINRLSRLSLTGFV